jgi:hypothetical protein
LYNNNQTNLATFELQLFTYFKIKEMTTTASNASETVQKVRFKMKRNLILVFIVLFLTGGTTLYAQDSRTNQDQTTEKRSNKDQRKVDRDKHKLDKKQIKTDKKARKVDRTEGKADQH